MNGRDGKQELVKSGREMESKNEKGVEEKLTVGMSKEWREMEIKKE